MDEKLYRLAISMCDSAGSQRLASIKEFGIDFEKVYDSSVYSLAFFQALLYILIGEVPPSCMHYARLIFDAGLSVPPEYEAAVEEAFRIVINYEIAEKREAWSRRVAEKAHLEKLIEKLDVEIDELKRKTYNG